MWKSPHEYGVKNPWSYLVFSLKSDEAGRDSSLQRYFNFDPVDVRSKEDLEVMHNVGKWQERAQIFFAGGAWSDHTQLERQIRSYVERCANEARSERVILIVNKEETVLPFSPHFYSDMALPIYKGCVDSALQEFCAATASDGPKEKETSMLTAQTQRPPPLDQTSLLSLVLQHIQDSEDRGQNMRRAKDELEAQMASWGRASARPHMDPHRPALQPERTPIPTHMFGPTVAGRLALDVEVRRLLTAPRNLLFRDQDVVHIRRPYNQFSFHFKHQAIYPIDSRSDRLGGIEGSARQGVLTDNTYRGWADTTSAEGTGRQQ